MLPNLLPTPSRGRGQPRDNQTAMAIYIPMTSNRESYSLASTLGSFQTTEESFLACQTRSWATWRAPWPEWTHSDGKTQHQLHIPWCLAGAGKRVGTQTGTAFPGSVWLVLHRAEPAARCTSVTLDSAPCVPAAGRLAPEHAVTGAGRSPVCRHSHNY